MNYRVLFFVISIAIVVMGSVLFFVLSSGAKLTQDEVLRQADRTDLESEFVRKGLFALGRPSFESQNHSCVAPFQDSVYVTLVMEYQSTPRSCDLFANNKFQRVVSDLKPSCIDQCPYEEFSRTLYVGELDARDDHSIRVCCNDICISKDLPAVCAPQ